MQRSPLVDGRTARRVGAEGAAANAPLDRSTALGRDTAAVRGHGRHLLGRCVGDGAMEAERGVGGEEHGLRRGERRVEARRQWLDNLDYEGGVVGDAS